MYLGTFIMLLRAGPLDKERKNGVQVQVNPNALKTIPCYCFNWGPAITMYYFELQKAISVLHDLTQLTVLSPWVWNALPPVCGLLHFPTLHPRKCTGNRLSKHCHRQVRRISLPRGFTETRRLNIRKPFPVTFPK